METEQIGTLSYETDRGREQLIGKVVRTTDYGADVKLLSYDYTLRVMKNGEVFTSRELIGRNAEFTA